MSQPCKRLTSSTLELRAQLNLTNDQKRRVTIPARMACAWNPHVARVCHALDQRWKRRFSAADKRNWSPVLRPVVQPVASDQMRSRKGDAQNAASCSTTSTGWKAEKWTTVSHYLDELLIQKCKFRDRFTSQTLAWKGFPRRVHTTLTKPVWSTHLLRNSLSNYWCGMHRTCKNTSV